MASSKTPEVLREEFRQMFGVADQLLGLLDDRINESEAALKAKDTEIQHLRSEQKEEWILKRVTGNGGDQ